MTAIVFNCAYNGLNIIQELGRQNIEVYALDSFRNVGTVSKFAKYRSCSNPSISEDDFIQDLLEMSDEFDDRPVLFPTNDHWAKAVARHREKLKKSYHPCVVEGKTAELLLDKDRFGIWAENRGYDVPKKYDGENIVEISDDQFPIVAKLKDTTLAPDMMFRSTLAVFFNRIFKKERPQKNPYSEKQRKFEKSRRILKIIENRTQLNSFIENNSNITDRFIFQEYVRGMSDSMYTVGVYANEGTVKGLFTGRKIRGFPPDIGDCKVGVCQSVPNELVEVTKSICRDLNYHGIGEFEFKRDSETGNYYLIEVNPRSWSWIGITPYCGVNLPLMAYKDLKNIENVDYKSQKVKSGRVQWVKASEDLMNCLFFNKKKGYQEWNYSILEWLEQIRSKKTVYAEFSRDDIPPALYAVLLMVRRLIIDSIQN